MSAAVAHRPGPARASNRFVGPGYGTALVLIAIAYALCATQSRPQSNSVTLLLQLVTVGLIVRIAGVGVLWRRIAYVILGTAVALTVIAWLAQAQGQGLDIALSVTAMASYLVSPVVIIRQQLRRSRVDLQTLVAAIVAYLLIGMFFAFLFNFIGLFSPLGIFGSEQSNTLSTQLFFSFSSLTTTGYGNVIPVGPLGQSIAISEAIVGQLFLVVAVARIVTAMVPARPRPPSADARS